MEDLFNADEIKVEMPNKILSDNVAKITVIGVGGGGCNMVNHMIKEGSNKVDLISANTIGATPFFNLKISDLRPDDFNNF